MAVADGILDIRRLRDFILPDPSERMFELRGCWSPRLGINLGVYASVPPAASSRIWSPSEWSIIIDSFFTSFLVSEYSDNVFSSS